MERSLLEAEANISAATEQEGAADGCQESVVESTVVDNMVVDGDVVETSMLPPEKMDVEEEVMSSAVEAEEEVTTTTTMVTVVTTTTTTTSSTKTVTVGEWGSNIVLKEWTLFEIQSGNCDHSHHLDVWRLCQPNGGLPRGRRSKKLKTVPGGGYVRLRMFETSV